MHVKFLVTAMYVHYNAHNMWWLITLVDIKFIPEIILMDFHWEKFHKLECMHKMFYITFCFHDTSYLAKNWNFGLIHKFVLLFIYFYLFNSLISLEKYCLKLEKTASSYWASLEFAVWDYHTANSRDAQHTSISSRWQNLIRHCDKMSKWSCVGMIECLL